MANMESTFGKKHFNFVPKTFVLPMEAKTL